MERKSNRRQGQESVVLVYLKQDISKTLISWLNQYGEEILVNKNDAEYHQQLCAEQSFEKN